MTKTKAIVESVEQLGTEIKSFRLSAPGAFVSSTPGSHLDLFLPNGLIRQYSIWNWSDDGSWGEIGVKDEPNGRGGSSWLHENLKAGDTIEIGAVRNNFELNDTEDGQVLIAGGVGVTPIVSMARRLKQLGRFFKVFYLARTKEAAGFKNILEGLGLGDQLHCHVDQIDGVFDLNAVLASMNAEQRLYVCGPEPLLSAVLEKTNEWSTSRVLYERFGAAPIEPNGTDGPFEVVLAKSDLSFMIPDGDSILDTLLDNGLDPEHGCADGACGACKTKVLDGTVDHRDSAFTPETHEADGTMCICVSRAIGNRLVLDL
tara:strand:- start:11454 stop:12398 length:945 start_codon:yes stop_codon:yes gene_type:complete